MPWTPRRFQGELLGQSDDDALRATQEAEPIDVLVLRDLADEFGTVATQAGKDVVDVVYSEVGTDVVEPDDPVHRRPLHRRLALPLPTQLGQERPCRLEGVH